MKSGWMVAVVMIGAVSMVGCVSQKKYEEAMVDVDSAKSELALALLTKECLGTASKDAQGSQCEIRERSPGRPRRA
mgnify:CR=1 FL=1